MDDWDATAKAVVPQGEPVAPRSGGPVGGSQGSPVSPPRWGLWLGLALVGLLTTVLLGLLFLRGSPVATVEVAGLPSSAAEVSQIVDRASEDTKLLVFVAQPGDPGILGTAAEGIQRAVRAAESPKSLLVISEQGPRDVGRGLPPTVRVVDSTGVIQEGGSQGRPGVLRLTTWTLALLATGILIGWALVHQRRPRVVEEPFKTNLPTPPNDRSDNDGTVDIPPPPTRGSIDLSPFLKPPVEPAAWIPQCPYCGAFRPRAEQMDGGGSHYRCSQCAEAWEVRVGETWPTVIIRPRHRRVD
jgi:hypothetical protein